MRKYYQKLNKMLKKGSIEDIKLAWELIKELSDQNVLTFFKMYNSKKYSETEVTFAITHNAKPQDDMEFYDRAYYKRGELYLGLSRYEVTLDTKEIVDKWIKSGHFQIKISRKRK